MRWRPSAPAAVRLLAAALFAVSVWRANADICPGCTVRRLALPTTSGRIDATLYLPPDAPPRLPGVVICHGYLASAAFMTIPWVADVTRMGAAALVIDRSGHGRSAGMWWPAEPPAGAGGLADLAPDVGAAVRYLRSRPALFDGRRLGLVGHSDGGTAAIIAASVDWDLRATVAVSPSATPVELVSYAAPRNLLLIYGNEDEIIDGSLRAALIGAATAGYLGGPGRTGEAARGTARAMREIPGAGHVDVLYDSGARGAALRWLASALALPGPVALSPLRFEWIALGLTALLLAVFAPSRRLAATAGARDRERSAANVARAGVAAAAFAVGLTAAPRLAWLDGTVPAQESLGVARILVALPLTLLLATPLIGGRPRPPGPDGQPRGAAPLTRQVAAASAYAAVLLLGAHLLCANLVPIPLDGARLGLWPYFAALGLPLLASLDRLITRLAWTPRGRIVTYATAAVALALSAPLQAERMGVLPIYALGAVVGVTSLSLVGASATWSTAGRATLGAILLGRLLSVACPLY